MRIDKEKVSTEIENILDDLGKPNNIFSGGSFQTNIVNLPNGKKAQVRVEITIDEDEFEPISKSFKQ